MIVQCGDDCHLTMADLLSQHTNHAFDYVYFNNDEFRHTFTAEDLHRSLSAAFPHSNSSQNHLYFVDSLDDVNDRLDDTTISYCADRLRSHSLIQSQKCEQIENALSDGRQSKLILLSIICSIAIIVLIVTAIVISMCIRRHYIAARIRKEFIRQIAINERHQFDYIQKLWKVTEKNVEIDYANQIGKGVQSIVYYGQFCITLCIISTTMEYRCSLLLIKNRERREQTDREREKRSTERAASGKSE